ncbi:HAD family hydrolase [Mucilaginibacter sp. CAU 1740]|uniref:HAD family hydrolase n=1 Tax=Mucilaginibacter sp. CAU 1740 TaxID=3140365 RepID=UPI00325B397E
MIKALIFDLDNTIFATTTISDEIFGPIYELMEQYRINLSDEIIESIKSELVRMPFQKIADKYHFPAQLKSNGIELLKQTVYNKPVKPYKDYELARSTSVTKFLVTAGFTKLQQSKVDALGVRSDFKEVIVVDQEVTDETKRDVFARLMQKYGYEKDELIAVGDDPESEIGMARDLGIKTYLYDPESRFKSEGVTWHEQHYDKLVALLRS